MSLSIERTSGPPNSFLAQMGIFTIPLIGPAVSDNPMLTQLVSIIPPLPELPIVRGAVTSVIMLLGLQMERDYIRVATVDPATGEKREPNVFTDPTSNAAFLNTQLQSAGYFQLADDEALVVTIDRKDAGYFNVPVTNDWTITDNYWDQPTSLNNAQSKPNADGTYTIVISKNDPGVYNWVSTGGLNQGTASIRFQDLGGPDAVRPTVSSKVVKISELDDPGVLPIRCVHTRGRSLPTEPDRRSQGRIQQPVRAVPADIGAIRRCSESGHQLRKLLDRNRRFRERAGEPYFRGAGRDHISHRRDRGVDVDATVCVPPQQRRALHLQIGRISADLCNGLFHCRDRTPEVGDGRAPRDPSAAEPGQSAWPPSCSRCR